MSAWNVLSKWNETFETKYRQFVARRARYYERKQTRFTCEDLALRLLIDYAESQFLPMSIVNGRRPKGMRPEAYPSFPYFITQVLATTGARDLIRDKNTTRIGSTKDGDLASLQQAQVGDIIHLNNHGSRHIQVIVGKKKVSGPKVGQVGYRIEIAQGNFRPSKEQCSIGLIISNRNKPGSRCYIGKPIEMYFYTKDGTKQDGIPVFEMQKGQVRRWNFAAWNRLPKFQRSKPGKPGVFSSVVGIP